MRIAQPIFRFAISLSETYRLPVRPPCRKPTRDDNFMIPKRLAQFFAARGRSAYKARRSRQLGKITVAFAQADYKACRDLNQKFGRFDVAEFEGFLDYFQSAKAQCAPCHIVVLPNNLGGRLVNYHHFFSGFLAPLIEILQTGAIPTDAVVLYPDLAMMNRHIDDVLAHYNIAGRAIPFRMGRAVATAGGFQSILVPGFDETRRFGTQMDRRQIAMLHQFRDTFAGAPEPYSGSPRVVFIDRGGPPEFYQSSTFKQQFDSPNGKTSGTSRRAIANAADVSALLSTKFAATTAYPEKMTLRQTAALFRDADVVVAQHGAGLANLYWCNPPCFVIEILPIGLLGRESRYFRNVSHFVGLDHIFLIQSGPFAPVNLNQLEAFTTHAVADVQGK